MSVDASSAEYVNQRLRFDSVHVGDDPAIELASTEPGHHTSDTNVTSPNIGSNVISQKQQRRSDAPANPKYILTPVSSPIANRKWARYKTVKRSILANQLLGQQTLMI